MPAAGKRTDRSTTAESGSKLSARTFDRTSEQGNYQRRTVDRFTRLEKQSLLRYREIVENLLLYENAQSIQQTGVDDLQYG